jgi:Type IV secretion system pilin
MSFLNKLFSGSILTIIAIAGFAGLVSAPAYAASGLPTTTTITNDQVCGTNGGNGGNCAITGGANFDGGAQGVAQLLLNIARIIVYIVGAVAVLFLVYGGVRYMTSEDPKAARAIITNAIIGLIVAIVAFSIVTIITGLVNGQFLGGN